MAKRTLDRLSRRERQIMELIYAAGQATATEVLERLPDPPSYSTVRALLRILETKGHLRHVVDGTRYVFLPTAAPGRMFAEITTRTPRGAIRFGLDVTLKATILFALALLLAVAIPRLSAAARHLLAILGLAGALALPLTTPLVPSVSVPLLPSLVAVSAEAGPEALRSAGAENRMAEESSSPAARRAADAPEVPPAAGRISPCATLSSPRAVASPRRGSGPAAWAPWALLLWAVGAAFSLARLAVGSLRVRALGRDAVPLAGRDWSFAAADLSGRLGLRRKGRPLFR